NAGSQDVNHEVVATFTDANSQAKAGDFSARIDWGDGSSSSGSIAKDKNGGFDVVGSHHYAAPGAYVVHVQIQDAGADVVSPQFYTATNLISDGKVPADHTSDNLVNPWGLAASGGSPVWIADNGAGVSTLTDGAGNPQALVVTIPPPSGSTDTAA